MAIWLIRVAILVVLLGGWELSSGTLFSPFFISSPIAIVTTLWEWIQSGRLFSHAAITIIEAVSGFVLGGLIGMTVGVILGQSRLLAEILDPFIMVFYSLPKIALAPLFVLWFGVGIDMKIILTATVVFFLVFLNTYTGVRNVSRELIAILGLMGASRRDILVKVVLPSAVTWVFAGLRLSVPYALIGAIVGELIAANQGLGYLLADASGQFDTAGVFAALVAIVILAMLLNLTVKAFEKRAMPWRQEQDQREFSI
jgi:NitT/TauT family transport system permease protein